jgi:threonine/homoserine/homoserine lactone efflux protein
MNTSTLISMGIFALVASLTPGPVNLVGVRCGAQFGLKTGLTFVTGATLGFVALFVIIGLGMHQLISHIDGLLPLIKAAGVLFLIYLSIKIWQDDGRIEAGSTAKKPTAFLGALMQWLNPKAWLASISGIATFSAEGGNHALWVFSLIYLVVCWLSLNCWVVAGISLRSKLSNPSQIQRLNRILAIALLASCLVIALD